jgi:hypothetical protein
MDTVPEGIIDPAGIMDPVPEGMRWFYDGIDWTCAPMDQAGIVPEIGMMFSYEWIDWPIEPRPVVVPCWAVVAYAYLPRFLVSLIFAVISVIWVPVTTPTAPPLLR